MRKLISLFVLYFFCVAKINATNITLANDSLYVVSPNGQIIVRINDTDNLKYSVYFNNKLIVSNSTIDLIVKGKESLSLASKAIRSIKRNTVNSIIEVPVSERRKIIQDHYNELTIQFKAPYSIKFRAFDNGIAYQIETKFKDSIFIQNEIADFNFPTTTQGWLPLIHKRDDSDLFHTSYEEPYPLSILDSLNENNLAYNPVLLFPNDGPKIAITESDLLDYPGMFLKGSSSNRLIGMFAPYPAEEKTTNELYPETLVTKRENYIAHVNGSRNYPWRILMIAAEDKDLPNNDLVYQLASPNKVGDVSWVHSGKATDEWIININLFNVPFKPGINTASYKYYIDFAKRFGFDRIMMDAGWSDIKDVFKITPGINMDTLTAYAKEKGIKISMWTAAVTLNNQLDSALNQFNKWGIDFIMTDFIDRDDQKTVQFYERIAKACAQHKIMIMYHAINLLCL